jgi:hypothetical protein
MFFGLLNSRFQIRAMLGIAGAHVQLLTNYMTPTR